MKQKNFLSIFFIISSLLLINCQSISGILATETPTVTATATTTPTQTPRPTPTRRPSLTPTPDAGRFTNSDGSYSFLLPDGWNLDDETDDYALFIGPTRNGIESTLVVGKVTDSTMFEMWTAHVQDDTTELLQSYTLISEDFLETDAGESYFRWEFTARQQGVKLHFVFYMYDTGTWKLVLTYMRLDTASDKDDALIDKTARSVLYR